MWNNYKSMPNLLKFLTAHALACIVFLIGSVIPHNSFSISGRQVTYLEWWGSGAGVYASVIGIILPISAWLLLSRSCHARGFYLCSMIVGLILSYLLFQQVWGSETGYGYAAVRAIIVAILAWYLYRKESVKHYFVSNH
jgi:hypothetical protein